MISGAIAEVPIAVNAGISSKGRSTLNANLGADVGHATLRLETGSVSGSQAAQLRSNWDQELAEQSSRLAVGSASIDAPINTGAETDEPEHNISVGGSAEGYRSTTTGNARADRIQQKSGSQSSSEQVSSENNGKDTRTPTNAFRGTSRDKVQPGPAPAVRTAASFAAIPDRGFGATSEVGATSSASVAVSGSRHRLQVQLRHTGDGLSTTSVHSSPAPETAVSLQTYFSESPNLQQTTDSGQSRGTGSGFGSSLGTGYGTSPGIDLGSGPGMGLVGIVPGTSQAADRSGRNLTAKPSTEIAWTENQPAPTSAAAMTMSATKTLGAASFLSQTPHAAGLSAASIRRNGGSSIPADGYLTSAPSGIEGNWTADHVATLSLLPASHPESFVQSAFKPEALTRQAEPSSASGTIEALAVSPAISSDTMTGIQRYSEDDVHRGAIVASRGAGMVKTDEGTVIKVVTGESGDSSQATSVASILLPDASSAALSRPELASGALLAGFSGRTASAASSSPAHVRTDAGTAYALAANPDSGPVLQSPAVLRETGKAGILNVEIQPQEHSTAVTSSAGLGEDSANLGVARNALGNGLTNRLMSRSADRSATTANGPMTAAAPAPYLNPGLVQGGELGSAGFSGATTSAAAQGLDEMSRNPFPAMDSDDRVPTGNSSAAKTSELQVGYQDPVLGYVELRARGDGSGVHASLGAESAAAGETLEGHLGSLAGWMNERHTPVESLTVLALHAASSASLISTSEAHSAREGAVIGGNGPAGGSGAGQSTAGQSTAGQSANDDRNGGQGTDSRLASKPLLFPEAGPSTASHREMGTLFAPVSPGGSSISVLA